MEQSNVVLIKLITGENVVCETNEDCDSYIEKKFIDIYNPVLVNVLRMPRGTNLVESYIMMPWVGFAKTDFCNETEMEIEEFLEQALEKLGDNLEEDEEYDGREDSYFGRVRRSTRTLH